MELKSSKHHKHFFSFIFFRIAFRICSHGKFRYAECHSRSLCLLYLMGYCYGKHFLKSRKKESESKKKITSKTDMPLHLQVVFFFLGLLFYISLVPNLFFSSFDSLSICCCCCCCCYFLCNEICPYFAHDRFISKIISLL